MTDVLSPIPTPRPLAGRRAEIPFSGDPQRGCTLRAGLIVRRPGGVAAGEGDPSFPEVFVGTMPSSTSDFEKRTSAGVSSPGALSYRTSQTSRTGRTARMTLGVYLVPLASLATIREVHLVRDYQVGYPCRGAPSSTKGRGVPVWGSAGGER